METESLEEVRLSRDHEKARGNQGQVSGGTIVRSSGRDGRKRGTKEGWEGRAEERVTGPGGFYKAK